MGARDTYCRIHADGSQRYAPRLPEVKQASADPPFEGRKDTSRRERDRPESESLQKRKSYCRICLVRSLFEIHSSDCCGVAATAEIIGAKWTALLFHDLSEGSRRFCELEHSCPGISPRTLSERLRVLEQEGFVERKSFPESPPRVEYTLTEKGHGLLPVIREMSEFAHKWLFCDHAHREDETAPTGPAVA